MNTYIIDIDGTIADASHRLWTIRKSPKDWDKFFELMADDLPMFHMRDLIRRLADYDMTILLYASGRPERFRGVTLDWLEFYGFPEGERLYMRPDGDRRDDDIIKQEILIQMKKDGYDPTMAFDDRTRVVNMWRRNGIPCLQVAPGDF